MVRVLRVSEMSGTSRWEVDWSAFDLARRYGHRAFSDGGGLALMRRVVSMSEQMSRSADEMAVELMRMGDG